MTARSCSLARTLVVLCAVLGAAAPAAAQGADGDGVAAYYRAVGEHFRVPANEIMILSEWRLPAEEIPVVLFVASRGGISPEAVVAHRRAGRGWGDVARRYRLDATSFHVPLDGPAGSLAGAYEAYRSRPQPQWSGIELADSDIVALVNLRVLAEVLGTRPEAVLQARDGAGSWVGAYRTLARR